jgi:hypothetical protein
LERTAHATCCDAGGEEGFPRAHVDVVAITVFSLVVFALCALIVAFVRLREKMALQAQLEEDVASNDRKEEKTRTRKESISNGLIVKEWVPDDASVVMSTEGDQDDSPSGEVVAAPKPLSPPIKSSSPTLSCIMGSDDCENENTPPSDEAVEASQPPAAAPINSSSPASCAMGSDDCDSLAGEEEMAGCAICLSRFKPQQLVCESNNSLCRHVFHKDCMVDWLTKHHEDCPLCREVYIIKAV